MQFSNAKSKRFAQLVLTQAFYVPFYNRKDDPTLIPKSLRPRSVRAGVEGGFTNTSTVCRQPCT